MRTSRPGQTPRHRQDREPAPTDAIVHSTACGHMPYAPPCATAAGNALPSQTPTPSPTVPCPPHGPVVDNWSGVTPGRRHAIARSAGVWRQTKWRWPCSLFGQTKPVVLQYATTASKRSARSHPGSEVSGNGTGVQLQQCGRLPSAAKQWEGAQQRLESNLRRLGGNRRRLQGNRRQFEINQSVLWGRPQKHN